MKSNEKLTTLFIGVDTHKETHTLVGTNVACEKLCELSFANDRQGFEKAMNNIMNTARLNSLKPIVSLEDTGGNGMYFANYLHTMGMAVKTVSPVLVKRNRRYQTHPEKSDSQDALEIAIVSVQRTDKLPDFSLSEKTEFAKDLSIIISDREDLVREQTSLKNKLHWALYKSWGLHYKTIYQKDIFAKRSIEFWLKYPGIRDFKKSRGSSVEKPEWLVKIDIDNLPKASDIEENHILRLLKRLKVIMSHIKEIDEELKIITKENYQYLTTCPGCGVLTASKIVAYTRDIAKFSSEKKLARYSGIAPKKHESGRIKRSVVSTRGNSDLRRAFKTIALAQIGRRGNAKAKEYFNKKIKEGKNKKQALRSLMRQNVKIVYSMMRNSREYYT